MKKILIFTGIAAAVVAVWYLLTRNSSSGSAAASPTVQTTGTATTVAPWWNTFATPRSLAATGSFVATAFNGMRDLSNAFGRNVGSVVPGVSVGGSAAGGIQSSGSGAGLPVATNGI